MKKREVEGYLDDNEEDSSETEDLLSEDLTEELFEGLDSFQD